MTAEDARNWVDRANSELSERCLPWMKRMLDKVDSEVGKAAKAARYQTRIQVFNDRELMEATMQAFATRDELMRIEHHLFSVLKERGFKLESNEGVMDFVLGWR